MIPMNGEFFRPTKRKILLGLALAAFFWFFPIASKSVVAFPFFSLTSAELSVALNVLAAYVFGCALAANFGNRKRLIIVALALVLIYLAVPKIASYSVGDIGGRTETYCDCVGVQVPISQCCGSGVDYCIGVCQRDEKIERWPIG